MSGDLWLSKKNATLMYVSSKTDVTPLPPGILEPFGHFSESPIILELFGPFNVSLFNKYLRKSAPTLLDLVNPDPFSTKKSKTVGAQKVSQNFWIASAPLWKKSRLKLYFFLRMSFSVKLSNGVSLL